MTKPAEAKVPPSKKVVVELEADEALVLFDTLHRMNAASRLDDATAQQSLSDLEARLEQLVPEVTGDNYKKTLSAYRDSYAQRAVTKR